MSHSEPCTFSIVGWPCHDHIISRFPAQEIIQGSSKVPSVIYYDRSGIVKAIGAEALVDGVFERAEDEGWFKAEW